MSDIKIVETENGLNVVDILKTNDIHLVNLDIMLPEKDGITVLKEIKAIPEFKHFPVIMCSSLVNLEYIEQSLLLRSLDYFKNPLDEEQIKITLPLKVKNTLAYYEDKNQRLAYCDSIKDEMKHTEKLQNSMISDYSKYVNVEMWRKYIPWEEIGGYIYCSNQVLKRTWFMLDDVSGHGKTAAIFSSILSVVFNTSIKYCADPATVLEKLNNSLFEIFDNGKHGLVSAFVGCFDGNTIQYANAGHPYPVFFPKTTNTVENLNAKGFLVGMFNHAHFYYKTICIYSGDAVIIYTDGLFDCDKNQSYAKWSLVHDFVGLM